MARTRPLPRKVSAPRLGRGKTIHLCSFPRCSLTLRLAVEFIISRLYIYIRMWRIEWIFNEHEHLTEIFRDFPTEILSRMKIRVAEFTFNWPRRIFHATLFLEQRTIHFGLQIVAPGNCKTRFYHWLTIGEDLPRDNSSYFHRRINFSTFFFQISLKILISSLRVHFRSLVERTISR